ncbi:hypothetical protein N8209_04425 [Gammaproteobacteria bacterium]|nr:hypothetical protein [Gammaproteobacteria bacterium]
MKSNLVRVDFRKNDKSEKAQDNHGFRFNQQKLFEGEVTIFQTKTSGDFWHMRMYRERYVWSRALMLKWISSPFNAKVLD